ncbi:GNAT family N-acetyltransferase [Streptomyces sp. NPDC005799]|uniref:bifunctional acetate--CoA ligase family protein/GNAT family N-acetyltransferase n=1 Tax=Streptomyces sp. NPDC005799 TaxID=3154678 RepID=UPI0034009F8B
MTDVRQAPVHALLTDGRTVRIRRADYRDRDAVRRLYEEMSPENLRQRFFTVGRASAAQAADRVAGAGPARPGYCALAAEHADRLVGLAEYEVVPPGTTAEISLAVAEGWHHHGVATLLVEHLADAARAAGVTAFTADTLSDNHELRTVFLDLGLHVLPHYDGPEVSWTVRLTEDEGYLSAIDTRSRTADVVSLRPLLQPHSVAVVGAGRKPGSLGRAILRNICRGSFRGRVFAVHPEVSSISGVHAYPSVTALPEVPDLAVIALPAPAVPQAAEDCGKAGVRALLVVSSGLDAHQAGALAGACRRYDMRLAGPDCLGLANTDESVRLDATFAAHHPSPGTAGVAVQSGGVGIALLDGLSRLGIGVSSFASLGDKYDVSGNDLLQWWESDGRTELALLHLESFGNPRAFSRTARRVSRRMPVLTVDAGRSETGRRTAPPAATRQALFTQAGITAAHSMAELLDAAALLHSQPLPSGTKVAVVSNTAGGGVLAADACADMGLSVPALGTNLIDELLTLLPAGATATNPVDTTAAVSEKQLRACVERLAAHGAVDAVLVTLVPTAVAAATGDDLVRSLTAAPGPLPRPVVAVLPAQAARVDLLAARNEHKVPAYCDAQDAARALAHAAARSRWLTQPPSSVAELADVETHRARDLVAAFLDDNPEGGWLDPQAIATLLGCYGVPQLPWAWARDEDEAVAAAQRLAGRDGRVVMKAHWQGLLHKSEQHAVHLDLHDAAQVRAAHRDLVARFGDRLTGVVIQPLAERGTEWFAGVEQDEVFGPLVTFGLGGTATELLADRTARLAPLTDHDVRQLITSSRTTPLLFGYAGSPTADVEALEQLLHRLSRMACDLPQLARADLNPVLSGPRGVSVLDVRVRLEPRHAHDPYLRRLR